MAANNPLLQSEGISTSLWQLIQPRVAAALADLQLGELFGTVCLCADDLSGDDNAWYRIIPGRADRPGPFLEITCHIEAFCEHRPLKTTTYPPQAVWEQMEAPRTESLPNEGDFSQERTDFFLNHHLLTISDLGSDRLAAEEIPPHLAEAFGAAWAVTVDGRLERRHLSGYPMAERRGRFSRLFSSAGILLPEHWQIFQSLWDGAVEGQTAVLGVTRLLPRL